MSGRLDRAVGGNDDSAVHLSDFLDPLAHAGALQFPLFAAVTLDGIEAGRVAHLANFDVVADDEQRADRFAFAPFAADFQRQIHHGLQRVQGDARFQLTQVPHGQAAEMVVEVDDAERIERAPFEAAIESDDGANRGLAIHRRWL